MHSLWPSTSTIEHFLQSLGLRLAILMLVQKLCSDSRQFFLISYLQMPQDNSFSLRSADSDWGEESQASASNSPPLRLDVASQRTKSQLSKL